MKYRMYNPRVGGPSASTDAGKKIIAAAVKAAMQDIAAGSRGGSVVEYPKGTYSLYLNEGVPKVDVSFSKENVHVRPESVNALTERILREGSAENVAAQVVAQVLVFASKPWRWTSALKQNPGTGVGQLYGRRLINPSTHAHPSYQDALKTSEKFLKLAKKYLKSKGSSSPEYMSLIAASNAWITGWYVAPSGVGEWTDHFYKKAKAATRKAEEVVGAETVRKNPGVEQVILLVLPHVTKALGSKVTAFNALPIPERKARLRAFLQSGRRWSLGAAGGLAGPQIAKSDTALNAIIRNVEHYGSQAVAQGGEEVATRLQKNPRRRRR